MKLTNLTFIVTDDCNFNCAYCFQKKEKKYMTNATIERTVDFFYPFLKKSKQNYIGFYGGEPLLAFAQVRHAVMLLEKKNKRKRKKIKYTLTTNGSLLNEKMLDFFNRRGFALTLSFDGLAQDKGRQKGSRAHLVERIKKIGEYPGIDFEINSVFTPQTIGDFYASMRFVIEQGCKDITYNLSTMEEWTPAQLAILENELEKLGDYLALYYHNNGTIPVKNFRYPGSSGSIFVCGAGQDKMAVTPGGDVWGCFLFHDYFKTRKQDPQYPDYYFGSLRDFARDYKTRCPHILANYNDLRQDLFYTEQSATAADDATKRLSSQEELHRKTSLSSDRSLEGNWCFLCENLASCRVCPVNAAYSTGILGKVPCTCCKLTAHQKFCSNFFKSLAPGRAAGG